jgi:hypothetical protein
MSKGKPRRSHPAARVLSYGDLLRLITRAQERSEREACGLSFQEELIVAVIEEMDATDATAGADSAG